ncbi:MAG: hypothetical protein LBN29_11365 [Mediterranea sp.]|jgi:dolichol kinase|nr:hypothetical protein [Mediterranea sp.]
MQKQHLFGTSVPAPASHPGRSESLIERFLPEEVRVKNRSDYYYVAAIGAVCATLIFPPMIVAAIFCVARARKEGGTR